MKKNNLNKTITGLITTILLALLAFPISRDAFADSIDNGQTYVVQAGDTVWRITQNFNLDMNDFIRANNITDPSVITVNDVVRLDIDNPTTETTQEEDTQPAVAVKIQEPVDYESIVQNYDRVVYNAEVIDLINQERERLGVAPLTYDADMQYGASIRTQEVFQNKSIMVNGQSHKRLDGSEWYTVLNYLPSDINALNYGENQFQGYMAYSDLEAVTSGQTTYERMLAELTYNLYRNSPDHYQAMINPEFTGIAMTSASQPNEYDNNYFDIYNTMMFIGRN